MVWSIMQLYIFLQVNLGKNGLDLHLQMRMQKEELYFSDDEEPVRSVKIEFIEQKTAQPKITKPANEKQERFNTKRVKLEDKTEKVAVTSRIKQQQDSHRSNFRSAPKDQQKYVDSHNINHIHVQKGQFFPMYFQYCSHFNLLRPSFEVASNPFLKHVYTNIMEDLRHRQIHQKPNTSIFDVRTYIMRHTLEQFKLRQRHIMGIKGQLIDLQEIQTRRLRKRSVKQNKRIKLPELPSKMTLQDVGNSFQNLQFAAFFKIYMQTGEMKRSILSKNYNQVKEFCEEIETICSKRLSLKAKKEEFNSLRKPMMLSEVDIYFAEATIILNRYCS